MFEEFESQLRRVVREELTAVLESRRSNQTTSTNSQPDLITITQAAAAAGVGEATLRGWVKTGRLKRYGQRRIVLVDRGDLMRFLATPDAQPGDELPADEWADMKLKQLKQKEQ